MLPAISAIVNETTRRRTTGALADDPVVPLPAPTAGQGESSTHRFRRRLARGLRWLALAVEPRPHTRHSASPTAR